MKDEELWHDDRSELSEDRRDDRRDTVTPGSGILGFIEDDTDRPESDNRRRNPHDAGIGEGVSNEVESFTDKNYEDTTDVDSQRIEDETTTRRDEELSEDPSAPLTNRERERRFHEDEVAGDGRATERDFQTETNPLRGETEESPLPQDVPSDRETDNVDNEKLATDIRIDKTGKQTIRIKPEDENTQK